MNRAELRRELDRLAKDARRVIRGRRRSDRIAMALSSAWPLFVAIPAAWVLLLLLVRISSGPTLPVEGLWVVLSTLAAPTAYIAWHALRASFDDVDARDSLAVVDQQLDLEDRLVTAEEFLDLPEGSAFVDAAIEDAYGVVGKARGALVTLEHPNWSPSRREQAMVVAGAVLLALGFLIGGGPETVPGGNSGTATATDEVAVVEAREKLPVDAPATSPRQIPETPSVESVSPSETESSQTRRDKPGELSEQTKESRGKSGEGRSSNAESTTGASESRGTPSSQSQESKASKNKKPNDKKNAKKPAADPKPTEKKNAEENSGSTAGKGSSKGSNKNPAVSRWASKDQVTTEDDQEIEDDEETEDEEEDQEARGGVQPNLRDRKPPVSRDLRIGFGNQKNPDANGRGGPSEAKKSRGTASLVLGVPIPDRVKGQPNPGKTKITQERIEPKAEDAKAIDASERQPREAPAGHLKERELSPWMRTLIREYFLTLRNQKRQS